ncbi:MAG: hypothetical protein GY810_32370 [Aureispira sp.]|nr:hypothetical protein [Aureispira sp.]
MGKLTAGGKLRESCLKAKRLEEIGNIYGINAARSAQEINNLKELNSGVLLRVREIDAALEKERKEADRFISVFDKKADKWIPICIAGYTVHHVKEYTLKEVTAYIEKRNTTKPRERIIYMQDKEACRWVEVRTKMSIGAVAQAAKGEDLFLAIFNEATKERGVICTAGYIVQTTNPMTLKEANRFNDVKNENCKVFERIKSYDHRADAFARFVKERKDAKHMNNYSGCL